MKSRTGYEGRRGGDCVCAFCEWIFWVSWGLWEVFWEKSSDSWNACGAECSKQLRLYWFCNFLFEKSWGLTLSMWIDFVLGYFMGSLSFVKKKYLFRGWKNYWSLEMVSYKNLSLLFSMQFLPSFLRYFAVICATHLSLY